MVEVLRSVVGEYIIFDMLNMFAVLSFGGIKTAEVKCFCLRTP